MTDVKIANIQIVELLMIAIILTSLLNFLIKGKYNLHHKLKVYVGQYFVFFLFLILLTIISFDQIFFIPPLVNNSLLQRPVIISLARFIQLFLVMMVSVIIVKSLYRYKNLLNYFVNTYVVVGTMNAIYGIISYFLLLLFNINIGGAYLSGGYQERVSGFFIEGGPFGLYLISVLIVTLFRRSFLKNGKNFSNNFILLIQFFAMILTQSKAAIIALIFLGIFTLLIHINTKKIMYGLILTLSLLFVLLKTQPGQNMIALAKNYQTLFKLIVIENTIPINSFNLSGGRASGLLLVPAMVSANPLFGVGLGNYSLVRNDPKYLQRLPSVDFWDLSGLGLLGYVAEMGIPLFLLFFYILFKPFIWIYRMGGRGILLILASTQLVLHLFGAQITFLYPWLVSAICMGYIHGGTQNFYRSLANKPSLSH